MFEHGFPEHWSTLKKLAWLKAKSGGGLPDGYTKVAGFTFNNNAYYQITNFKLRGSDTIRFSFAATGGNACNVLGAYDGTTAQSNFSLYVGSASNAKYLRYNGGTYNSQIEFDVQYNVALTPTGSAGMKNDSSWTEKEFESEVNLCIGTTSPTATSSKMVGNIIGNIIVDGRLKLIPCKRDADNVLGYYDTYSGTFYEPTGGTPTVIGG